MTGADIFAAAVVVIVFDGGGVDVVIFIFRQRELFSSVLLAVNVGRRFLD